MNRIFASILLTLMFVAVAGPLEAADCKTRYRIWQDGSRTYYNHGEPISLNVGDKVDLYIHAYPSGGEHPYSASADIGVPTAFGFTSQRPQDVSRVLKLGAKDPQKGKISLTAVAAGGTALGYRITGVAHPGRLEKVPQGCRTGEVRIKVRGAGSNETPGPGPAPTAPVADSANDAVHALIVQLYSGILRRSEAESDDYPDNFFDQVQRDGLQGLISVAETMTSSSEFRSGAISRTREALTRTGVSTGGLSQPVLENQLLSDIFTSLYGSAQPYADARRRMASDLSNCLSGRSGNACRDLAQELLRQPQFEGRNRELLRLLR